MLWFCFLWFFYALFYIKYFLTWRRSLALYICNKSAWCGCLAVTLCKGFSSHVLATWGTGRAGDYGIADLLQVSWFMRKKGRIVSPINSSVKQTNIWNLSLRRTSRRGKCVNTFESTKKSNYVRYGNNAFWSNSSNSVHNVLEEVTKRWPDHCA